MVTRGIKRLVRWKSGRPFFRGSAPQFFIWSFLRCESFRSKPTLKNTGPFKFGTKWTNRSPIYSFEIRSNYSMEKEKKTASGAHHPPFLSLNYAALNQYSATFLLTLLSLENFFTLWSSTPTIQSPFALSIQTKTLFLKVGFFYLTIFLSFVLGVLCVWRPHFGSHLGSGFWL